MTSTKLVLLGQAYFKNVQIWWHNKYLSRPIALNGYIKSTIPTGLCSCLGLQSNRPAGLHCRATLHCCAELEFNRATYLYCIELNWATELTGTKVWQSCLTGYVKSLWSHTAINVSLQTRQLVLTGMGNHSMKYSPLWYEYDTTHLKGPF